MKQLNIFKPAITLRKAIYSTAGLLLLCTIMSGIVLASTTTHANTEKRSNASVIVKASCTMTTGGGSYAKEIMPGNIGEVPASGINVSCNDSNGYALYTAGYSGDEYDTTNSTKLLSANGTYTIPTGTSGSNSYWAMKATGSGDTGAVPTIDNSFGSYHVIPSTYTKLSHVTSATVGTTSNSVTTPTYKISVSSTQPANTYTGKVKYILVHPNNNNPIANMQNWAGCSGMNIGDSTFLIDTRDKRAYNVIKHSDGKCWMTTNLDLPGGTALSATDTDVTSDYISSFTTSNNLTKSGNTIVLPASSTTGFDTDNYSYVYNSGKSGTNCSYPGCYSYYSWDAATLGSGRSITTYDTDAPHSICPKDWRLPNTRAGTNSTAGFRQLMISLGGSAEIEAYTANTTPTGATMSESLSNSNLAFLRAGYYHNSTFSYGGSDGRYWSATSHSGTIARDLYFNSTDVYSTNINYRMLGFSVRCITE